MDALSGGGERGDWMGPTVVVMGADMEAFEVRILALPRAFRRSTLYLSLDLNSEPLEV
jgi:hypothetical protein